MAASDTKRIFQIHYSLILVMTRCHPQTQKNSKWPIIFTFLLIAAFTQQRTFRSDSFDTICNRICHMQIAFISILFRNANKTTTNETKSSFAGGKLIVYFVLLRSHRMNWIELEWNESKIDVFCRAKCSARTIDGGGFHGRPYFFYAQVKLHIKSDDFWFTAHTTFVPFVSSKAFGINDRIWLILNFMTFAFVWRCYWSLTSTRLLANVDEQGNSNPLRCSVFTSCVQSIFTMPTTST